MIFEFRSEQQDALKVHLESHDVSTFIHYPKPPHRQACYHDYENQPLPIAEMLAGEVLSLPMFSELYETEVNRVVAAVLGFSQVGDVK